MQAAEGNSQVQAMWLDTRGALTSLGFHEDWEAMSDCRPGYRFNSGPLELRANQVMSRYFRPVFLLTGSFFDSRSAIGIEFEMPLQIESLDQAKAWIAHGAHVQHPDSAVPWLAEGIAMKHLLPWERARRLYEERPQCSVSKQWMRLAIIELRAMAMQAVPADECVIAFDGKLLTFRTSSGVIPLHASSSRPWPEICRVRLADFADLPRRLMQDPVGVHVWEAHLVIGSHRFAML